VDLSLTQGYLQPATYNQTHAPVHHPRCAIITLLTVRLRAFQDIRGEKPSPYIHPA